MDTSFNDTQRRNQSNNHEHQEGFIMKSKLSNLIVILGSVAVMGLSFALTIRQSANNELSMRNTESSISSADDPHARAQWEFKRLHDPSTGEIPGNIRAKELAFAATLPSRESIETRSTKSGVKTDAQSFTWSARGPSNVGGRTRALAIDAANTNVMLAGGVSGGMWRSTDGGTSWSRRTNASGLQSVTCIAQDTRAGNTTVWYYGSGEGAGSSASATGAFLPGDGIFKSTDNGLTWSQLSSTVSGTPHVFDALFDVVWNIVTDPSNASEAEGYAETYGALYRSTNGGTSWSVARGGVSTYSPYVDVAITSTGVVYAALSSGGTNQGLWRSPDGVAWTNITPTGWPSTYNRAVIGIAPSNENVVYFLSETPGSGLHTDR